MFKYLFLLLPFTVLAQKGRVVAVKDGDTIEIIDSLNNTTTIRFAGIDCPEKSQDYGQKAKQFTSDLIYNKEVRVAPVTRDRYGRTVAWIYLNNDCINELILVNGYAWHYIKYDTSPKLDSLEAVAKSRKRGLWSQNNPTPPWDYRHKAH